MSTDRELLELVAKAAGIAVVRSRLDDPACRDFLVRGGARNCEQELGTWNPRDDDGDCARLEAALGISVLWAPDHIAVYHPRTGHFAEYFQNHTGSRQKARRAASVRLAAEIGKSMP